MEWKIKIDLSVGGREDEWVSFGSWDLSVPAAVQVYQTIDMICITLSSLFTFFIVIDVIQMTKIWSTEKKQAVMPTTAEKHAVYNRTGNVWVCNSYFI